MDPFVSLTHEKLNASAIIDKVRSPAAGAIVLFAGTTRNNFAGKVVVHLDYEAFPEMAIPSLRQIASEAQDQWTLFGVAVTHRLGRVPIGEESILIAVSAGHRKEAWEAAEWILEEVKRKTEIWKKEVYEDPNDEPQWKANRDVGMCVLSTQVIVGVARPVVVSGPSGCGKSTLLDRLFKKYLNKFGFSVSRWF
jgi:molybdopterin synthase catalytic subunit